MKPGKPLARRIGLKTNTPLRSKKPIDRIPATGSARVNPRRNKPLQSKPAPKTPEELDAREKVETRSRGKCEARIPGVCQGQAREFQHRLAKAHMGPWTASNGLAVCGHGNLDGCHGYIHQHPTEAVANGWTVKSGGDPSLEPVLYRGRRVLLDNNGDTTPVATKEEAE